MVHKIQHCVRLYTAVQNTPNMYNISFLGGLGTCSRKTLGMQALLILEYGKNFSSIEAAVA